MFLLKQSACPRAVKRKGSILIISLWSLCLLSAFAVILSGEVRQKITLTFRLEERSQLQLIAEGAVRKVIVLITREEKKGYDLLIDYWNNAPAIFSNMIIGQGRMQISYDYIDDKTGKPEVAYGLVDEERKININKADAAILRRLFKLAVDADDMQAQELAASIIDWRDKDSELSLPIGSAEDSYYQNFTRSYEAKDNDMEVLDELLLVKGMNQEILDKIKNYITIYGGGIVNANTASKTVLICLGLSELIADKIVDFRLGEDGVLGTKDDNFFDTPTNIVPKLSQYYKMSDSEVAQISPVCQQHLGTASDNFMLKGTAKIYGRSNTKGITCVFNRAKKILYWRES